MQKCNQIKAEVQVKARFKSDNNQFIETSMQYQSDKSQYALHLKCITWYKDSHSLFDYESTKVSSMTFDFALTPKNVAIYRKRDSFQVVAVEQSEAVKYQTQQYQLLTKFNTIPVTDKKIRLNFSTESENMVNKKNNENDRLNTDESNSSQVKTEQQTYLIVRKLKKQNGEYLGYRLEPGHIVKLGRVEFFVSETCIDGKISTANSKNKARVYSSRNVMKYNPLQRKVQHTQETQQHAPSTHQQEYDKPQCKICLEETEETDNFLFNPCICSGSCGTVHLECLTQWIHFKVKKQVVGGTQHYNFEKFKCEVCKTELPMILDINGIHKQLLPIQKPQGNYLILQGACDKQKSIIMIQNIPNQGIKLGRGHQCQIRITDISVSRNHGLIKNQADGFYIFDNKSKFGTLVREQKMQIEISRMGQGVQIGRTVVSFQLRKQETTNQVQQQKGKTDKGISNFKLQ